VIHVPLVPAAAPICADDFGAASYVSPPPWPVPRATTRF